jgi:hypothetical protein
MIDAMSTSDSNRPTVLAHQRFLAGKDSFAGLNLAQRFRRIQDTNLWGAPASTSGLGSEIDATAVIRSELPRLLERLGTTQHHKCGGPGCSLFRPGKGSCRLRCMAA